jgi:hypothetical protein
MKHFATICLVFLLTTTLSASLVGQGVGHHTPVQVNTKIPGFKRGLKAAVSSSRTQRYKRILSQSQNTWNTSDDNAYIAFWNTLTKDNSLNPTPKNFIKERRI